MVNFSLNAGSLMGIVLAFAGAGLYFLRSFRPNLARDYDVFFAAIALICGGILFFQSWRLDPILQFGVFLLAGSTVFFAVDSIRLRDIATEQAKRNTPLVDDDRPVSRSYQYQSEDYGPGYDRFESPRPSTARRIRGSRDFQGGGYDEGSAWGEDDYDRRGGRRQPRSLERGRDREPERGDAGRVRARRASLERSDYGDAWDSPGNYGNDADDRPGGGYAPGPGYQDGRYDNDGGWGEGDRADRDRSRADRSRDRGDRAKADYSEWGYGPGETAPRGAGYEASGYGGPYDGGGYGDRGGSAAPAATYPESGYGAPAYGAPAYGAPAYGDPSSSNASVPDPAANYGTPLVDPNPSAAGEYSGEYGGGIDPTEDPSVYGNGGSGAYDTSYSSGTSSRDYGGAAYGSGEGSRATYGDSGYGDPGYGAASYGGADDGAAGYDRSDSDPNRRPRRRPPSTLLSRSPYGDDEV